jgi:tape measure domain-containing protein
MPSSQDIILRLRLMGAAAFNSAATSAAASVRGIGTASQDASKHTGRFGSVMDKAAGPIGAIAGLASNAAVGLGAAGVAAAGMGLKFNAGMEQSQVAFTNLLGSSDAAEKMLDTLYKTAANTPFEFPQLTQATQRLLGFGMSAKDVVPTMTAVGDAVAAAGGGSEQIDRVSTALGQMQAKGKVSSEELMQLAESGVPALKILGDQLGLTGAQLSDKLQKGAVSADVGIKALVDGMNKRYKGMASQQSKTFSGMISTLKDNAAQVLGKVTMPLFEVLRDDVLPAVNKVTEGIGKWANAGGVETAINALKAGAAKGSGPATAGFTGMNAVLVKVGDIASKAFKVFRETFSQLMGALKPAMPFFSNVLLPLLKGVGKGVLGGIVGAFKIAIPVIRILATVLGWVGTKLKPLSPWIEKLGMLIGFMLGPSKLLKPISWLGKLGGVFRVVAGAVRVALIPMRLWYGVLGKLGTVVARVGPAVAKTLGLMWSRVKTVVSDLLGKFRGFGKGIVDAIVSGVKAAPGALLNAIRSMVPGPVKFLAKKVPGLNWLGEGATGLGPVSSPGMALVGERGPEIVSLNRGAQVIPLPSLSMGGGDTIVPVYLDGREITRVVARRAADKRARR